ncbi:hypothetical protein M422DRAFT_37827 [Sphaerobolus stellatus SS14]|uniref:Unplaced genomic scaffold SPHSTscaffold_263, whole genome shotgun sequence n=1 Tax=Sphaerobolus stellatus (strain SS14) TaxID=990650 RepID=A0A0C9TDQ5_SPHS4|nr:hypothetical protein M422DRAFT_37827 [Sphaerobolus stellatus SS14]
MSGLSNIISELTEDLKEHTLSPGITIFSLPNEILVEIFPHCLEDFPNAINYLTSEANAVPIEFNAYMCPASLDTSLLSLALCHV